MVIISIVTTMHVWMLMSYLYSVNNSMVMYKLLYSSLAPMIATAICANVTVTV